MLRAAREFVVADADFAEEIREFFERGCKRVDEDWAEEQKLEYSDLHADFCELVEARLTAFVERNDWEPQEFFDALRASHAAYDEEREAPVLSKILLSVTDYPVFMGLMRETKRGARWDLETMYS